jgi:hypothetical protein
MADDSRNDGPPVFNIEGTELGERFEAHLADTQEPEKPKFIFDAARIPPVHVRLPDGMPYQVEVRFPTDHEWGERRRAVKFLTYSLGRGVQKTDAIPSPSTDMKIYEKIKLNGAPPLDDEEASRILDTLGKAEAKDCTWTGAGAVVKLSVPRGTVIHALKRVPTAKEVRLMRESSAHLRQLPNNVTESRLTIEAPAKLWQDCGGSSENYAGAIPALHKDAAIRAVIQKLDNEISQGFEETDDF